MINRGRGLWRSIVNQNRSVWFTRMTNTWVKLRPRQNDRHFPDDTFKRIFLNEMGIISIKISRKFVSKCPINKIPALFQIMAWRQPGDKPSSQPMMVRLLTHICVTRLQWVNSLWPSDGVSGAVRFLEVGTVGKEERPPRGQLWMEQYLISLKYWPIWYKIWADPNYIWGFAILTDSLLFSVNNILAGLWLNCILSVEITLFLLADILLQHRALFQC